MREEIRERGKRGEERKRLNGGKGILLRRLTRCVTFREGEKETDSIIMQGQHGGERGRGRISNRSSFERKLGGAGNTYVFFPPP